MRAVALGVIALLSAAPLWAADRTTAGEFVIEPPTLLSLGFEWYIDGDDNHTPPSRCRIAGSVRGSGPQADVTAG